MFKKNSKPENIEKTLETYYQIASPPDEFLEKLEMQLNQAAKEIESKKSHPSFFEALANLFSKQTKWLYVPVSIALLIVVMMFTIGPARVLASVQSWLRYVPGYGFIDQGETRALAAPISETRDGVVVTVKQVYADQNETYLVINVQGGPSGDEIMEYLQPLPEEDLQTRAARGQALYETDARLILPDGTILSQLSFGGSYWDGFIIFPSLPLNVLEATFQVTRLPGVPDGWLPEGWTFDITLEYVDVPENLVFPEPHYIGAVSEPFHGLRARVLDVVYANTEIAIRVEFDELPEGWTLLSAFLSAHLEDELGREYPIIYGPRSGRDQDGIYTVTFTPPHSDAKKLKLSISELFVDVKIPGSYIHVDFGDNPAIGDTLDLNTIVDVFDQQVIVESVQILDSPPFEVLTQSDNDQPTNTLSFELVVPKGDAGIEIHGLNFGPAAHAIFGRQIGGMSGSMSGPGNPGELQILLTIDIPADQPLPTGAYDIPLDGSTVLLEGPFEITWEIK